MKNAFAIVTLTGLLTACAVAPVAQQPVPAKAAEPMPDNAPLAAAEAAAQAEVAAEDAALPKVALSSALLYELMKAEFEIRKGNLQAGYQSMLKLAAKTRDPRLARRATELALQSRQEKEAFAAVKLWRELAPQSDDALQYYLGMVVASGDLKLAEPVFAKRLQDASAQARGMAMYQVQQFLASARDKVAAQAMFERLLAPYAATFEARVLLAQNASARGDLALAAQQARAALALKPDSEVAVLTLAQATKDPAALDAVLRQFLAANPGAREVRLAHARVLVASKQYPEARKQFETLLAQQPDHLPSLYGMGLVAVQMNDRAAAEKHLARYITLAEQSGEEEREPGRVLLLLAQLAQDRGDSPAALAWLGKISEREGDVHFAAQLQRASLLARQGDLPGARKLLGMLMPEAPAARAQLALVEGQILRDAGLFEEAFTVLAGAAGRFPANTELLYDYALLAEKMGRTDVMETALRSVIAQAPDNHHAYNALGYSLAERNVRLDEALALIGKALAMAPGDPFIMDSMGWVHYRLGNLDQAEAHLRKAYALRNDADIAVHLGEVLYRKGQKAAAQQLLREAKAKDPKNDALRSTLARLQLSL